MRTRLSRAHPSDLETLIGLEALTFPEDPWSDVMLAEELSSPASRYWIARGEDDTPLGYAGVKIGGDQADVMTIGVRPEARGRGLGAALLDTLLRWAAAAAPTRSSSTCVHPTPRPSACMSREVSSRLGADLATFATPSKKPWRCEHS